MIDCKKIESEINCGLFLAQSPFFQIVRESLLGANPLTWIYNASVVNFYNATSLARFENKIFYST
jgi:hypothetical protein